VVHYSILVVSAN